MKLHKWHNEIVAYAKGADIESIYVGKDKILYHDCLDWELDHEPHFFDDEWAFRIKPQPKEPQYLYVYANTNGEPMIFAKKKVKTSPPVEELPMTQEDAGVIMKHLGIGHVEAMSYHKYGLVRERLVRMRDGSVVVRKIE